MVPAAAGAARLAAAKRLYEDARPAWHRALDLENDGRPLLLLFGEEQQQQHELNDEHRDQLTPRSSAKRQGLTLLRTRLSSSPPDSRPTSPSRPSPQPASSPVSASVAPALAERDLVGRVRVWLHGLTVACRECARAIVGMQAESHAATSIAVQSPHLSPISSSSMPPCTIHLRSRSRCSAKT